MFLVFRDKFMQVVFLLCCEVNYDPKHYGNKVAKAQECHQRNKKETHIPPVQITMINVFTCYVLSYKFCRKDWNI